MSTELWPSSSYDLRGQVFQFIFLFSFTENNSSRTTRLSFIWLFAKTRTAVLKDGSSYRVLQHLEQMYFITSTGHAWLLTLSGNRDLFCQVSETSSLQGRH